jgi:hypothetical protein
MAYTHFDRTTPDAATQSITEITTSTRANFAALQDAIITTGTVPQWDAEAQDSDGGTPPTTPETPDQIVYSKDTERVKVAITWSGDDLMTSAVFSYSSNGGTDYDSMGTITITYDVNDNYLSHAWS